MRKKISKHNQNLLLRFFRNRITFITKIFSEMKKTTKTERIQYLLIRINIIWKITKMRSDNVQDFVLFSIMLFIK